MLRNRLDTTNSDENSAQHNRSSEAADADTQMLITTGEKQPQNEAAAKDGQQYAGSS